VSAAASGMYSVHIAGHGMVSAYCDMDTDGGGWTVLWSTSGADDEEPFTSDTAVAVGDTTPLAGGAFNIDRTQKALFAARPSETLIRRSDTAWLRVSHAPVPPVFGDAAIHPLRRTYPVTIAAANGLVVVTATGSMGVSTSSVSGGGDFSVSLEPVTSHGMHASADLVNTGCSNQLVWSYSSAQADSDGKYGSSVSMGSWSAQGTCDGSEGGGVAMTVAVRELAQGACGGSSWCCYFCCVSSVRRWVCVVVGMRCSCVVPSLSSWMCLSFTCSLMLLFRLLWRT